MPWPSLCALEPGFCAVTSRCRAVAAVLLLLVECTQNNAEGDGRCKYRTLQQVPLVSQQPPGWVLLVLVGAVASV
jgi:hypothetical protein